MNELDKISEKILKQVIKHDNSLTPKDFNKIKCLKKFSEKEVVDCLGNLKSLGYLHLDNKNYLLNVTFKGKQYFLLKSKQLWKNIILSFLLPLIIAIVAAYFTAKFTVNNDVVILINSINEI